MQGQDGMHIAAQTAEMTFEEWSAVQCARAAMGHMTTRHSSTGSVDRNTKGSPFAIPYSLIANSRHSGPSTTDHVLQVANDRKYGKCRYVLLLSRPPLSG